MIEEKTKAKKIKNPETGMMAYLKKLQDEKGITNDEVVQVIIEVFSHVITTKVDPDAKIEIEVDFENSTFKIFNANAIVIDEEEENIAPEEKIYNVALKEAQKIDANVQEGDIVRIKIRKEWIDSQTKRIITSSFRQKTTDWFKKSIYEKFAPRIGQSFRVRVESINQNNNGVVVRLMDGNIPAYMPSKLRNQKMDIKQGQIITLFLEDVKQEARKNDAQLIVSNGSAKMLKKSLEDEIPEVRDGLIEIIKVSRHTGFRAKIAVRKTENAPEDMDAVGSIIGVGGKRINEISKVLGGEKIDVVAYDDDIKKFIINAISPSKVVGIKKKIDTTASNHYIVIVPDEDNTKAIGAKGRNVSLTVELTNARIDIVSVSEAKEKDLVYPENGNYNTLNYNSRSGGFKDSGFGSDFDMKEFETEIRDLQKNMQEQITNTSELDYQMPKQPRFERPKKEKTFSELEKFKSASSIYAKNQSIKNKKTPIFEQSNFTASDVLKINEDYAVDEDEFSYDLGDEFNDDDWD